MKRGSLIYLIRQSFSLRIYLSLRFALSYLDDVVKVLTSRIGVAICVVVGKGVVYTIS